MKYSFGLPSGNNGLESLSDHELVTAIGDGSHAAMSALMNRYSGVVYRVAHHLLSDDGEAEDVVQQVFFEVFKHIQEFDETKGTLKTWILTRASSRTLDRVRQLQAKGVYEWTPAEESSLLEDSTELLGMNRPEIRRLVEQLLGALPPKQQSVVQMRFFRGLSLKEIQEETREPMQVVLYLLYDALEKMRAAVSLKEGK